MTELLGTPSEESCHIFATNTGEVAAPDFWIIDSGTKEVICVLLLQAHEGGL